MANELERMKESPPLHLCHVHKSVLIINRLHSFLQSAALVILIYYRASFLFKPRDVPILLWLLVFASELLLCFIWGLGQAYRWRPVSRSVFPERLPEDKDLPSIDVFICTADPNREPTVVVMNTVLSAMALDYPPEKLCVYVSDDGGSLITLRAMREAWVFARSWLPFCGRYGIKTSCPEAYFSSRAADFGRLWGAEFMAERKKIEEKYMVFREQVLRIRETGAIGDTDMRTGTDHSPVIEVINEGSINSMGVDEVEMPLLVYVSREKRPSQPHHFKAGALNVLLRVSSIMSNSPYILMLDCDMYCNDPSSARQALCFHLDPNISHSLAFVQFPQKFHNVCENDIYDSQLRSAYNILWTGLDGLRGPILSGTGFYIRRKALLGSLVQHKENDLVELKQAFGDSNEFIRSLCRNDKPNVIINGGKSCSRSLQETQLLASCTYENCTKWGEEVGFLYHSVAEDFFTGFILHCKGWTSVYCNPPRPQFLGSASINLSTLLVQGTRWGSGLIEVGISRFCPLIYGSLRMSVLESMCYAQCALFPLYCLPLWCFATIPQLCLLNGIPLYPQVSNPFFLIFLFVFLSSLSKHLHEVFLTGGSVRAWRHEQRIWMMKSITCHLYGSLDAFMKMIGMREASFLPTNKDVDSEQVRLYKMGKYDFQMSPMFLAPLVALVILNMAAFAGGVGRMVLVSGCDRMFAQVFLSFYILIMSYPIIEGMMIRKDKGRIPLSITLLSAAISTIFLSLGFIVLKN